MRFTHRLPRLLLVIACSVAILVSGAPVVDACTGITLIAEDGTLVSGRTLEWGAFDLKSRVMLIPRGHQFVGTTPDGQNGLTWTAKYGAAGIEVLERNVFGDGMNEKGLTLGLFYHKGFAEYRDYDPAAADRSVAPTDVGQYLLSRFATVDEVRSGLGDFIVVTIIDPALGFAAPLHFLVSDPTGDQIVIEFRSGEAEVFEAPLGVTTNSPTYDWHMTNLRNYVNLSAVALPAKEIEGLDFAPMGGGSGMIGLPGDFTPPSRFVRAVAWSQTARPTKDGPETIYELFRILDNFNVPLGAAEGSDDAENPNPDGRSATIWTTANDTRNRVIYYHTQHSRRVRRLQLNEIDFGAMGTDVVHLPLDEKKAQDILDVTPGIR